MKKVKRFFVFACVFTSILLFYSYAFAKDSNIVNVGADIHPPAISSGEPNNPPEANAGLDQPVNEGAIVKLDGTGSSDPDGDTLSYGWTQTAGPVVALVGADTARPSFTAPEVDADTTLIFQLTVDDRKGGTDSDSINILVKNVPSPPTSTSGDAGGGPPADTTPPTVWLASPGAGWSLTSTIGVIVGAADDVGVSRVDFYIDGASVSSDDTLPYTYDWNTTTVADGAHTISATAYDTAGNVGTAAIPVTVANAVPTVAAAAPIAQAAPRTMFQVHAGAFTSLRAARARVARLARRGFPATIINQGGRRPYLIEIGLFEDLGGARALLRRLFARRIRFARILQVLR